MTRWLWEGYVGCSVEFHINNFFGLAMAHGGRGQKDEALRWYQEAMKQMPADRSSLDATLLRVLDYVHSLVSTRLGIKADEDKP